MNPVTAQMSPALLSIMSGPAPTNGVFQDLLDISVPLADTLPQLPVKGATPATAPIGVPAIPLAVPPLAEVQNGAETDVLPQATAPETKRWTAAIILPQTTAPVAEKPATIIAVPEAKVPEVQTRTTAIFMPQAPVPEINIEDGEPVAAEKPDASLSQIDPQFVPLSVVQTPPSVSAPVKAAAPPIAPPTTTPNLSEPAPIPAPTVQAAPQSPPPFNVPVTPLAPHARKLPNATEPPKSSDGTPVQWRPIAPQELVTQMDALPDARSDAVTTALRNAENKPQMPAPLPSLTLGVVDARFFSFEAPSGIQATPAPVTAIVAPTGTPIAELKQLIITADGEWVGALARDIVHHATRDNQLAFTLVPEHLGQLDIAVTTDNGKVDIRLETSTQAAAQAIATEQARLIEDLRHAGLKLGQFDMSNRQNGHGQQQGPQPDNQRTDNDSTPAQAKASSKAQGRFA